MFSDINRELRERETRNVCDFYSVFRLHWCFLHRKEYVGAITLVYLVRLQLNFWMKVGSGCDPRPRSVDSIHFFERVNERDF